MFCQVAFGLWGPYDFQKVLSLTAVLNSCKVNPVASFIESIYPIFILLLFLLPSACLSLCRKVLCQGVLTIRQGKAAVSGCTGAAPTAPQLCLLSLLAIPSWCKTEQSVL